MPAADIPVDTLADTLAADNFFAAHSYQIDNHIYYKMLRYHLTHFHTLDNSYS